MKRSLRTLLFAALVLSAAPVLADAPIGQYKQFVKEDDTIEDTKTLLAWERFSLREKKNFGAASTGCIGFAGRLPTVKELLTLVDEQPHQEYEFGKTVTKMIDQNAFGSYTGEDFAYWSSTPTGSIANEYWGVSFRDGTMTRLKSTDEAYARCVK
jgi:hypothetical protein